MVSPLPEGHVALRPTPGTGRAPRKRGWQGLKPQLSDEHTAVLIARDWTDAMLERVDTASVTRYLALIVAKRTLLIGDGKKAYGAFTARQGILHVWTIASKGGHVRKGYHSRPSMLTQAA